MRSLKEAQLLWFTRGQGRITVAGTTRGYGTHNVIFPPAGAMYGFEISAQVFGTALFLGPDCDLPLPALPQHLRIRDAGPQSELTGILDNIHRELTSLRAGAERAARHHLGLVGVWLERQMKTHPNEAGRRDATGRLVQCFTTMLEAEFHTGEGVADYAAALSSTPTHLSRVCRQARGRPASALVQDRVLFEARKLLSETDMKVADVSVAHGFTSPAYFTRAFQQHVGKTLTAFRKSQHPLRM